MTEKIARHYQTVKEFHPEFIDAVENLGLVSKGAGPVDSKTAQLIQLAASVACRSEGAVHSHTKRAMEAGATKDEIRHTVIILTNTIGFPSVMAGLSWVNDIINT